MDAVIFTYTCCFNIPREFDTFPNEKQRISRMNAYIFLSNLLFLYIGFFGFLCYNGIEVKKLKVNTSKSKNAESFYIKQSYIDSNGKSTSRTIRKLGTLKELLVEHGPTRDDVMAWAKEQARIETEKFEQEKANHCIPITFHPNRKIAHGEKRKFQGGYLFLQSLYYELGLNKVCRKIRDKHHYDYDLNAILSDLIYTRILEPGSKRSSFETAKTFLEAPTYQLHDIYRALNVLSEECDLIQSELYRNSKSVLKRNYKIISSTIHFPKLHRIPPSKGFAQYYLFFPSRISTMVFSVPVIPGDAISPILCMVSSGVAPLIPWAL